MPIPGVRFDPLPAFNFHISLLDSSGTVAGITSVGRFAADGGFTECSGLEGTLLVEEYSEGGENSFVHKFPTRMTYSNLTLKRGMGLTDELWNWHFDYVNGKGKRRDGVITLRNEALVPVKTWIFKEGLPLKWTGPMFNASQSAVAFESIEIAHHGLVLLSPGTALTQVAEAVESLL